MGEENEHIINNQKAMEKLMIEHSMADTHTQGRWQQLYTARQYQKTAKKVKPYCTIKHNNQPRRVSQKELTICNFPSNFRNYSLSQMPSDGKLIASQFRFQICVGLVLVKYSLHVLHVWY